MTSRGSGAALFIILRPTASCIPSALITPDIPSGTRLKKNMRRGRKINLRAVTVFCFLLFVFLASPFNTFAADDPLQEISGDEKQEILRKLSSLQKDIHSICSSVTQDKQLSAVKDKIHVEGLMIMAKPDMLRWETVKPRKSITVIDGRMMTVYYPDEKEAQVYTLSENFIARNTMTFFRSAIGGDLSEMEKRFTVNVFRGDNGIIFKLTPLSRIAGRYISSVTINYDEATGLPKGFEMTTARGDRTVTTLANIQSNYTADPDIFKIRLPDDVTVTNRTEMN